MPPRNQLDLKHNVGDTVQLQFFPGKEDEKYYVKLLGFSIGKSIIVSMPRLDGRSLKIDNEQQFIVRLVSGQTAQGFTASVLHATKHPFPHLHLSYPENLESITIRKAERVNCTLIVSVKNIEEDNAETSTETTGISASMTDISSAGAQLTTNEVIGKQGEKVSIHCKINIADLTQYLNITGIIRRASEMKVKGVTKHEYGIEFVITEDTERVLLQAFIYEQMLSF